MRVNARPKSLFLIIGAAIGVATGFFTAITPSETAYAQTGDLNFSLYATHPYASQSIYNETSKNYYTGASLCEPLAGETKRTCPTGQTILDMEVSKDGQLVAGYGDWNSNSDSFGVQPWSRVGVVPLDLKTNSWGSIVYAGSESLNAFRKFDDGTIYTATTDPSDKVASGQTQNNRRGFITNAGGDWQFMSDKGTAVHLFDTAKDDKGYVWVFGSADFGGSGGTAVAWRTKTGNDAWEQMKADTSTGTGNGFERYYWGAFLKGKMYMQASSTNPATPLRVYDTATNTWTDGTVSLSNIYAKLITNFDDHIVYSTGSTVNLFDGDVSITRKSLPDRGSITDLTKYDGKLYVLTSNRQIYRLDSARANLILVGKITGQVDNPSTLAIYDDYAYVGGNNGKIWRSDIKIPQPQETPMKLWSSAPSTMTLSQTNGEFIINGQEMTLGSTVKIGDLPATVTTMHTQTIHAVANIAALKTLLVSAGQTSRTFDISVTSPLGETSTLKNALMVSLSDDGAGGKAPVSPDNPTNGGATAQNAGQSLPEKIAGFAQSQLAKTGLDLRILPAVTAAMVALSGFIVVRRLKINKLKKERQ